MANSTGNGIAADAFEIAQFKSVSYTRIDENRLAISGVITS
jgi:hypothetical protein